MNDDGTNIIVSQQRRDLVFGDWASATIFVPRRVWIRDKLLHHLLRCYFRAVVGEHRPQSRQQLYSDAWLIWSAREVNRRPTCLLGPTTTSMLRNLEQQLPICVQPIVEIWRLRRLQVLDVLTGKSGGPFNFLENNPIQSIMIWPLCFAPWGPALRLWLLSKP